MANKDKRSTLMSSENDFLQPNTGDIPLETIDHLRKMTMHLNTVYLLGYLFIYFNILFFGSEQMRLKPIPLNEFHAHVKKMHENRDYGFEEEYQVCKVLVI